MILTPEWWLAARLRLKVVAAVVFAADAVVVVVADVDVVAAAVAAVAADADGCDEGAGFAPAA